MTSIEISVSDFQRVSQAAYNLGVMRALLVATNGSYAVDDLGVGEFSEADMDGIVVAVLGAPEAPS